MSVEFLCIFIKTMPMSFSSFAAYGNAGLRIPRGKPLGRGAQNFPPREGGVSPGGQPNLSANIIRDHRGIGVLVAADAFGLATIQPDNVFLHNLAGNVVRDAVDVGPPAGYGAEVEGPPGQWELQEDLAIIAHLVEGLLGREGEAPHEAPAA